MSESKDLEVLGSSGGERVGESLSKQLKCPMKEKVYIVHTLFPPDTKLQPYGSCNSLGPLGWTLKSLDVTAQGPGNKAR